METLKEKNVHGELFHYKRIANCSMFHRLSSFTNTAGKSAWRLCNLQCAASSDGDVDSLQ